MSEQTPATQDTSAVGGPEGTASEAIDWQQRALEWEDRYGNMQPEYTRATQEVSQQRELIELYELMVTAEDPDIRRQAAEALGYEYVGEPAQPGPGQPEQEQDPFKPYDERIARLEMARQEQETEQSELEHARAVRAVLDERLEELLPGGATDEGIKFDQDQILAYAINALPVADDGMPDIQTAFERIQAREDARMQAWAERKRQAPVFSPNGQTGTQVPDLDNDQERQDYMVRRLQAGMEP